MGSGNTAARWQLPPGRRRHPRADGVAPTLLAADLLTTDRTLLGEGHGVRWAG